MYAALSFIAGDAANPAAILGSAGNPLASQAGAYSLFDYYKLVMGALVLVGNVAFIINVIAVLCLTLPSEFWQLLRVKVVCEWGVLTGAVGRCGCNQHSDQQMSARPSLAAAAPFGEVDSSPCPAGTAAQASGNVQVQLRSFELSWPPSSGNASLAHVV